MEKQLKPCEKCGKIMEKIYGSGRFCSQPCARSSSTSQKRKEINDKVSKTLTGKSGWSKGKILEKKFEIECRKCGAKVLAARRNKKWCDLHQGGQEKSKYILIEFSEVEANDKHKNSQESTKKLGKKIQKIKDDKKLA